MTLSLIDFVKQLPEDLVFAPIYKKGASMRSGRKATGKNPLEESYERDLGPHDAVLAIERDPENLTAIGLFTGLKGKGIVILDCDRNLSTLKRKWKDSLQGAPLIQSTKRNAAKYVFRVPEELWGSVKGHGLNEETGHCYELLWGRQGLIYGAYPGGQVSEPGEYSFEGDMDQIPVAPGWMLAEMKSCKADGAQHYVKSRDSLYFDDRSDEEKAQILQECLNVLPPQGAGSHDHWLEVGMICNETLPNDLGLTIWKAWSCSDPEYADVWENGGDGKCGEKWRTFKPGRKGNLGLGTLISRADEVDPRRTRFCKASRTLVEEAENKRILETRPAVPNFEEFYEAADKIFSDKDCSVGKRRYLLNRLASNANIKIKAVQEVTEMYLSEREKRMGKAKERTAKERYQNPAKAHYYVPGIFCAGVWLLSGEGGSGKTNTAWALARKFLAGEPLRTTTDGKRTTEKGSVLWLSGDQMDASIDDQIITHLKEEHTENLVIKSNFNINDHPHFMDLVKEHQPKLVVIDSLRSCHRGTGVSENDSEFALPLRWFEQMMGDLFPSCMMLVLHHSGIGGSGPRGTSALKDMCSFSLNFEKPGPKSKNCSANTRFIHFMKHRFGLTNHCIRADLQPDGSVNLNYLGVIDTEQKGSSIQDRIRLVLSKNPEVSWTVEALSRHKCIDTAEKDTVRKALSRLKRQGLAKRSKSVAGSAAEWVCDGVYPLYKSSDSSQPPVIESTTTKKVGTPIVPPPTLSHPKKAKKVLPYEALMQKAVDTFNSDTEKPASFWNLD